MRRDNPAVEVFQGETPTGDNLRTFRLPVFIGIFLLVTLLGMGWNFSRTPVYRTSANLLTVQPAGVDVINQEEDRQHVAIQQRLLLSDELLMRVADVLRQNDEDVPDLAALREMLAVAPVEGTNLVELSAQGGEPALLQRVVTTWIRTYLEAQSERAAQATDRTHDELVTQQRQLATKLEQRRNDLQKFRAEHDISSLESSDNAVHARLRGLNEALNKARERAITARANLQAHEEMAAAGAVLVPEEEATGLRALEREAETIRVALAGLLKRYTQAYLDRDPEMRELPRKLALRDAEITRIKVQGRQAVLAKDQAAALAADKEVRELEQQLVLHKREANEYTARFAQHTALGEELAQLEELYKDNEKRLARIDLEHRRRYPEYQIVDHPFLPQSPIWPHFGRDAGIVLGLAVLFALFGAWLTEYLTRRPTRGGNSMTGVRVYANDDTALPARSRMHEPALTADMASPALPQHSPKPGLVAPVGDFGGRDLGVEEITALLEIAPIPTAQCIVLLLHGVAPQELAELGKEDVDPSGGFILVPGEQQRMLKLYPGARRWLGRRGTATAWRPGSCGGAQLAAALVVAATDAGLDQPAMVNAAAIRHAYILFLVRQGARLTELAQVLGPVSMAELSGYVAASPPGVNLPLDRVNLLHPALA